MVWANYGNSSVLMIWGNKLHMAHLCLCCCCCYYSYNLQLFVSVKLVFTHRFWFLGNCGVDAGSRQSQELDPLNMTLMLILVSNTGLKG